MKTPHRVWYRWIRPLDEDEEAWRTGPLAHFDPQRIAVTITPSGKRWRLEVHALQAGEGPRLVKQHGGWLTTIKPAEWQPTPEKEAGPVWRVTPKLAVVGSEAARTRWEESGPGRSALLIPAGMAFGTGEHATTAMMLRQLGAWAKELPQWRVLDAGTGSGILALAAHRLGARSVIAVDNDATAIRVAGENEALNFDAPTGIKWRVADLTRKVPGARVELIVANLFANVLVALAPSFSRMAQGAKVPVVLAMSGILGSQAEEVRAAYEALGWCDFTLKARGKWRMIVCRR